MGRERSTAAPAPGMIAAMADILSLSAARKARDRAAAEVRAQANRALHGRTKAAKANEAREAARRAALLDGARREEEKP